jgi:hypothetical protein
VITRCGLVESFSLTRVSNIPVTWPFSIVGSRNICCFNSDLGVADMMVSPMLTQYVISHVVSSGTGLSDGRGHDRLKQRHTQSVVVAELTEAAIVRQVRKPVRESSASIS